MINLIKPFFAIVLISYSFACFALDENDKGEQNQITIEADELIYNKKEELISAQGNVYIEQNNFRIVANKVVYDKQNNYLYAVGDLAFSNNDKNYFFGKKAFFNKKNDAGVIIMFKARIGHKGLLSSDFAQMVDKNTFIVKNLVFSTCKVCKDNFIPNIPLWQIRAKKATLDQKEKKVEFKNSKIELFGVPIFYFPYFSIPTPNSPRKSGFLVPKFKNSNVLGLQVSIPYYFNITPQMDLTYTPTVSNKNHILNSVNMRYLIKYGQYEINGDLINDTDETNKKNTFKGYINSKGDFKFNNNYFLNYKFQRLFDKDKILTKKYDINDDDILTSNFSLRKETKNQLLTFEGISFQNLREYKPQNKDTPYVLPWIRTYNRLPLDSPLISDMVLSTDILNLRRAEGISYTRSTFQLDSFHNITLPIGQILNINPTIRYDYYDITGAEKSGIKNRLLGKLSIDWKWPFIKFIGSKNLILEPIVNFTYNSNTTQNFLNEDGQSQIISTSNIFSSNFFTGKDNVEIGSRLNFGVRTNYYTGKNTYGMILGQSYKLNKSVNTNVKDLSYTWDDKFNSLKTEIVGKFYAQLDDKISIIDNISLTPNRLNLIKNELDFQIQHSKTKVNLNYIFISKKYINKCYNAYNQEVGVKFTYNFNSHWGIETGARRKLGSKIEIEKNCKIKDADKEAKSKWINNEIGLFYKGDCLKINFGVIRDYSRPKDLKSSVTTYLKIEPIFN
jgi:LPS-assembly protein